MAGWGGARQMPQSVLFPRCVYGVLQFCLWLKVRKQQPAGALGAGLDSDLASGGWEGVRPRYQAGGPHEGVPREAQPGWCPPPLSV